MRHAAELLVPLRRRDRPRPRVPRAASSAPEKYLGTRCAQRRGQRPPPRESFRSAGGACREADDAAPPAALVAARAPALAYGRGGLPRAEGMVRWSAGTEERNPWRSRGVAHHALPAHAQGLAVDAARGVWSRNVIACATSTGRPPYCGSCRRREV
ncbi:hypothetical protein QJS66_07370 [Kocuria rhizophila]|nr:hypothetical protein QJS66_07370 [Kocuria rhizophila]